MFFVAGALLYPVARAGLSLSGVNDFMSAGNHVLHGRVKKAAFSTLNGGFKLGISVGLVYIMVNSTLSKFPPSPLENISKFKGEAFNIQTGARALEEWAFVKDSTAEKMAQYCTYLFNESASTNYEISHDCLAELSSLDDKNIFRNWILEDPISAAFKTSKSFKERLNLLTEDLALNNTNLDRDNTKEYFKELLALPGEESAIENVERACESKSSLFAFYNKSPCIEEIKEAKKAYFKEKGES